MANDLVSVAFIHRLRLFSMAGSNGDSKRLPYVCPTLTLAKGSFIRQNVQIGDDVVDLHEYRWGRRGEWMTYRLALR